MAAKKDDFSVKKISPKLGGDRGTRNPNGPTSSHDLVEQMEFLYVRVVKAMNYSNQNPIPHGTVVEITFGNCKSSTTTLPFGGPHGDWEQVFAFDKTKGDVLSVTLKVKVVQPQNNPHDPPTVITVPVGKQNFKLAADIPSRVPPDASIAPQWYTLQNTENGYHMNLQMSVWFGTQADEVYSKAWFSDASHVNASCVINTRPTLYLAPRLCYVRVTIVSGHDLISNDGKRPPSVYVRAILGKTGLKTGVSSGSNPSWNQDLIFLASDLNGTVHFELIDRVDDQHEECIGKLEKKVSEMTALKVPGSAPVMFYDIRPPVKVEPAGDTRRFSSRIRMKLATDQAYHVTEECSLYSSDYRAFAKGLWPGVMGKLEIGILGATDLQPMKDSPKKRNAYVVAKYGNKWARTRTMVENSSPKWNEQYSWDIYDKYTVITLGIYDNQQLLIRNHEVNDAPVGKVRIRLVDLEWDWVYTSSFPILNLGSSGVKKMGEIQLAIRATSNTSFKFGVPNYPFLLYPFSWMLPKAHYKSPVSHYQMDAIRAQAVELNCLNLARTEPPLRNEVVKDILKPKSKSFSMRRSKANYERLYKTAMWLYSGNAWINANVRYQTDMTTKIYTGAVLAFCIWAPSWIWWFVVGHVISCCLGIKILQEGIKLLNSVWDKYMHGIETPPPPLVLYDLKLSKLDSTSLDELAEEFDSFPTSESDVNVLRMRYDRMRKMGEKVMVLMGDLASQGERLYALWSLCNKDPLHKICFYFCCFGIMGAVYYVTLGVWLSFLVVIWLRFPCMVNDLPSAIKNFFRRLPTNEHLML